MFDEHVVIGARHGGVHYNVTIIVTMVVTTVSGCNALQCALQCPKRVVMRERPLKIRYIRHEMAITYPIPLRPLLSTRVHIMLRMLYPLYDINNSTFEVYSKFTRKQASAFGFGAISSPVEPILDMQACEQ